MAVYGGTALGPQIGGMRRGVDIIVGTPGRIIDHMEQGNLNLVRNDIWLLTSLPPPPTARSKNDRSNYQYFRIYIAKKNKKK